MIITPDFDAETHRYTYRGLPLVSVTQALRLAGLSTDPRFFTPGSAERGTAVHLATQYDDEGDLDQTTLDPAIVPYLRAWRKFKSEFSVRVHACEIVLASIGSPSFAGTIDRRCSIGDGTTQWLIDLKSGGQPTDADEVQLAGYSLLIPGCRLANVYVHDNESYTFVERPICKENQDIFIAAVRIAEWKIRHKKERNDNGHVLG